MDNLFSSIVGIFRAQCRQPFSLCLLIFTSCFIAGCGSTSGRHTYEDVDRLTREVRRAQSDDEFMFLAKSELSEVDRLLNKINALRREGKDVAFEHNQAKALFENASKNVQMLQSEFKEILQQRKKAIQAGADTLFVKGLDSLDKRFLGYANSYLKSPQMQTAARREKLLKDYDNLELASIRSKMLAGPRELILQATLAGAEKYAVAELNEARRSLGAASRAIQKNRYDTEEILKWVDRAYFDADILRETVRRGVPFSEDALRSAQSATVAAPEALRPEESKVSEASPFDRSLKVTWWFIGALAVILFAMIAKARKNGRSPKPFKKEETSDENTNKAA